MFELDPVPPGRHVRVGTVCGRKAIVESATSEGLQFTEHPTVLLIARWDATIDSAAEKARRR